MAKAKESEKYQTMLSDLEVIVRDISAPELDLDDMVAKVANGYDLIKKLRKRLTQTKDKITVLRTEFQQDDATEE